MSTQGTITHTRDGIEFVEIELDLVALLVHLVDQAPLTISSEGGQSSIDSLLNAQNQLARIADLRSRIVALQNRPVDAGQAELEYWTAQNEAGVPVTADPEY